jgi:hypothetical protein
MAERIIELADLSVIERNLQIVGNKLQDLEDNVGSVDHKVVALNNELAALTREFEEYVISQGRANRLAQAETRLVQFDNELNKKYGHYDVVRRSATGILQADDLGLIRQSTINTISEELMVQTPGYWLAPCLVALAAWINDKKDIADRAVREGIRRNDEKTSLFFALVCRRADRAGSCLQWTKRYLDNQDEEDLDRKTVIILDAYASGLMGADTEGLISKTINEWMDNLISKPGFVEQQTDQWSKAIVSKRKVYQSGYTYLPKYSPTWKQLVDVMEGAELHGTMLDYFINIFQQQTSTATLREQLDGILDSLVKDFDDEELPLRRKRRYEQLVKEFEGDEKRAKAVMDAEQQVYDTHKDFTQLLTDAAMDPEGSGASSSTQKFAVALTKDWIISAYNDVTAKNRMNIPQYIDIAIGTFKDRTEDGRNEQELEGKMISLLTQERDAKLAKCVMSGFDQFCLYGGGVIGVVGLLMMFTGHLFLGIIAAVAGIFFVVKHFSSKKSIESDRQRITQDYENLTKNSIEILRALMAEIVDFIAEFNQKDARAADVVEFLEQISPEQYVRKLSGTRRHVRTNA